MLLHPDVWDGICDLAYETIFSRERAGLDICERCGPFDAEVRDCVKCAGFANHFRRELPLALIGVASRSLIIRRR
jgi:hypothetical protein